MFSIDVPMAMRVFDPEKNGREYVRQLKGVGANRVFLCPEYIPNTPEQSIKLVTASDFLKREGFETGIWISSIYHIHYEKNYRRMVTVDGETCTNIVCPSDENYVRDFCQLYVKPFVETGIKTVMFDDDMRMNFNDHGPLCFCDAHMEQYAQILGHPITREEMRKHLLSGEPNAYRDAWLAECRTTLLDFAKALRQAADEVNPDCRLALCSGPALWGVDGAMAKNGILAVEITQILAGKQKPHLRLNGCPMFMSPYFQSIFKHKNLAQAIEFDRQQAWLCKNRGITAYAENDSYPRPRYAIPAVYLELFEMIARADGNFDGMQKYVLDYVTESSYETGYVDAARENQALYQQISEAFDGKTLTGITVLHPMDNIRYRRYRVDGCTQDLEVEATNVPGHRYLNDNSVPVVHEGDGPVVIFGNAAEQADKKMLIQGAILDLEAAEIFTRRGYDVGLVGIQQNVKGSIVGDIELSCINFEHYLPEDSRVPIQTPIIRQALISQQATMLSELEIGGRVSPGSYLYENQDGLKFYVLVFDVQDNQHHDGMFRSYHRQKHLVEAHRWLTGRKLDAVCLKHPDLYIMTKKNESELAVGLWNFSADAISSPVVELGEGYSAVSGINCEAKLEKDKVILPKLHAFEFAGFVAER